MKLRAPLESLLVFWFSLHRPEQGRLCRQWDPSKKANDAQADSEKPRRAAFSSVFFCIKTFVNNPLLTAVLALKNSPKNNPQKCVSRLSRGALKGRSEMSSN